MSAISLRLPESLHNKMRELAETDGISINQFATVAIAEKLSALLAGDYIEKRSARGNRADFETVMAKVASIEPDLADPVD